MRVKIKKLRPNAVIPTYAKDGDAGLDLTAVSRYYENGLVCYGTGLAIEIPNGYVGLLFPRSSISARGMMMINSVGVIDSGYRGEIVAKFTDHPLHRPIQYNIGERVGQLIIMPYPTIEFVEAEELSKTERGEGGYGSSGR